MQPAYASRCPSRENAGALSNAGSCGFVMRRGSPPSTGIRKIPRSWDIAVHALTGHPAVVVRYSFASPQSPQRQRGTVDTTGGRPAGTPFFAHPQPICGLIAGNLYQDDALISVAHAFERHSDAAMQHPRL